MSDDSSHDRVTRPRFSIGFLLWFLCVVAIGYAAYSRWMAYTEGDRRIAAERAARDAGVPIFDIYFTTIAPIRNFNDEGNLNPQVCAPYINLADPNLTTDEIRRMQPFIGSLIPRKGKTRIGVFLASEHFDDTEFVDALRSALPNCEVFNDAQHPGFTKIMTQ